MTKSSYSIVRNTYTLTRKETLQALFDFLIDEYNVVQGDNTIIILNDDGTLSISTEYKQLCDKG